MNWNDFKRQGKEIFPPKTILSILAGTAILAFGMVNIHKMCIRDRIWNAVSYVSMLILEVIFHTAIVLFCMYSPVSYTHLDVYKRQGIRCCNTSPYPGGWQWKRNKARPR